MNAYLNDDIPSKSETASFFDFKHNTTPHNLLRITEIIFMS